MTTTLRVSTNTLFSSGVFGGIFGKAGAAGRKCPAAGFYAEALDFLIQGGQRNLETFGGFGLIPVGAFEHIHDDAAFNFFQYFEQRGR